MTETQQFTDGQKNSIALRELLRAGGIEIMTRKFHANKQVHKFPLKNPLQMEKALAICKENRYIVSADGNEIRMNNSKPVRGKKDNSNGSVKLAKTPVELSDEGKRLMLVLKASGYAHYTTPNPRNDGSFSISLRPMENKDKVIAHLKTAGLNVEPGRGQAIILVPVKDTQSQNSTDSGSVSHSQDAKSPKTSRAKFKNQPTGDLKSNVLIGGEAFMGLLRGIHPDRLNEAMEVVFSEMEPRAQKNFITKLALSAGIPIGGNALSDEDAELLKLAKEMQSLKKKR